MPHGRDEDTREEPLTVLESRVSALTKYGWKGVLIAVAAVVFQYGYPIYEDFELKTENKAAVRAVEPLKVSQTLILTLLMNLHEGAKLLDADDVDYIARNAVASQSIIKVNEIEAMLRNTINPEIGASQAMISNYERRVKLRLKEILVRNTKIYVKDLNRYQHSAIGRVGDYIWETFPMDEFMQEMYKIIIYTGCRDIDVICKDTMDKMLEAQNDFFSNMKRKMKEGEK